MITLLEEVFLGEHYFQVAIVLRKSLFLNGILFNGEAWLEESDIRELEEVGEISLRKVLKAHSKL